MTNVQSRPKAIDLFAGAGGLSVGLKSAGFDIVSAIEFDPTAANSYRLNHRNTQVVVEDIRNVTGPDLLRSAGLRRGELDLLTGCPPCQGFSTLRTRRSTSTTARKDDAQNELLFELLRLARSILPRSLILENVPGLVNDVRFERFQRGLSGSGYTLDFRVLNAADFGVPQRRKRLVLIATREGTLPKNWSGTTARRRTVRDAIDDLPAAGTSGDELHDFPEKRTERTMARIRSTPHDGGSRADADPDYMTACHRSGHGYSDVYGRMAWNEVAPTITSGCHNPSKGRFIHPVEDRAITLREAALLQTFPRWYKFNVSRGKEHTALQIGNAFPPRLILPIARRLRKELQT